MTKQIIFKDKTEQTFYTNNQRYNLVYNLLFGDYAKLNKQDLNFLLFVLDSRGLIDSYTYDDIQEKINKLKKKK
jgi:hypothetical protein